MPHARPRVLTTTPVFIVSDLRRAARFWTDVLGFAEPQFHGEPACFFMANRNGFDVMLSTGEGGGSPRPNGPAGVWDAYFRVADLDAEIAAITAAGGKLLGEPRTAFYGMREVEIDDPDGYRICFGQEVSDRMDVAELSLPRGGIVDPSGGRVEAARDLTMVLPRSSQGQPSESP